MSAIMTIAAWLLAAPIALVTCVFLCEIAAGLPRPRRTAPIAEPADRPNTVILIPAHDEEAGIGRMLASLAPVLDANLRALVVADNCSDRTATMARLAGAEVIERNDPDRRGKGFALAFGRDHLRSSRPECVIVLDADCRADASALQALAATARATGQPVQADYRFFPSRASPPLVQVSSFAFAVKNSIRQQGLSRLGAPALLTGTGMAFPWSIFADAPLATSNVVEDLALGIDLLERGHPPRFLPSAIVWSDPSSAAGTISQRSRWESGFVATARQHALPLIARGVARLDRQRLWLGLHLTVPPLALLLLLVIAALAAVTLLTVAGANPLPLLLLLSLLAAIGLAVLGAWVKIGRAYLGPAAIARLPLYLLWKIPVYMKMLRGGEKRWIRTEREP